MSPASPGLTNAVAQSAELTDCITHYEPGGISILAAGQLSPNPLELFVAPCDARIGFRRFVGVCHDYNSMSFSRTA